MQTKYLQVNVEKVLERDQKLSQLDDRADALQEGASQFEKSAATLKRKYWWKNIKMMIIMCGEFETRSNADFMVGNYSSIEADSLENFDDYFTLKRIVLYRKSVYRGWKWDNF